MTTETETKTETFQSPDALTDALMELIASGESKGGEGDSSKEEQETKAEDETKAEESQSTQDEKPNPQTSQADDFETRYAARRQQEKDAELSTSRMAELKKFIEEGDDAEVGKKFKEEFVDLQHRSVAAQEAAKNNAAILIQRALNVLGEEAIKALPDDVANELVGYADRGEVDKFLDKVVSLKVGGAQATDNEAEIERRVAEKLQAHTNAERGTKLSQPSATAVPNAQEGKPVASSNDDLWGAALTELAEAYN